MMKLSNITDLLEAYAPLSYQESYDNSGLIVGDKGMNISSALICIDSTEEVIDEAIEKGCNLVIAHHPIVFSGIKKLNGKNYVERAIIKAIKNNIAIYAIHTNLDNAFNGVSAKIAEKLGLSHCHIISPKKQLLKKLYTFCPIANADSLRVALFKAGAGHIGEYSECSFNAEGIGTFKGSELTSPYVGVKNIQSQEKEVKIEMIYPAYKEKEIINALLTSHPYEEVAFDIIPLDNSYKKAGTGIIGYLDEEQDEITFLEKIKESMSTECIRHTRLLGKKIKKVALCGGAGSFLLKEALALGADIFITADVKYHEFFDAEEKIILADIGHYESEQLTKELLNEILKKNFPNFAIHLSYINTNPINYF